MVVELLEDIRISFYENIENNPNITKLLEQINSGLATYIEAEKYADEIGASLVKAFQKHLSSQTLPDGRMYEEIAEGLVRPLLKEDYQKITAVTQRVQNLLNKKANIGLKAQVAPLNTDRIDGIIGKLIEAEQFDSVAWVLDEPVTNFSLSVVDETLKANIEFQGKVGLKPKIVRIAEVACCSWCSNLEGEYSYPNVPKDVYRRHRYCRCTVDYIPGRHFKQDVWSKKWNSQ